MSHTKERIEMVKLLQRLREDDEKPGAIVLRALRALEAEANKKKGRGKIDASSRLRRP